MDNAADTHRLRIALISLHGAIRAKEPELGRDADTGGQVKYVLELAAELARQPQVAQVEVLTRQIIDDRVGPDYAQLEEVIEGNAKIVRIPFGPRRYLRKEVLWPYIDMFVDQTLAYFRRTGLPDVIHGHYADAGLAGAQLARLLHIPYVFTGHSLGRVKRQHLSMGNKNAEALEKKFNFSQRIEAEEIALETAAMVVTSTNQEVEQQYGLYEHYVPSRMEVIPPGVDLSAFYPPEQDAPAPPVAEQLASFLRDMHKPMILTVARPDERKNLEMLVRVYGQSRQLQQLANLVMVMGQRADLRELPRPQQKVLRNVLDLIDLYDLYGKVAYPKSVQPTEVPDLYRCAAQGRGVFINPALTEPFGLTLLEAAATGLPIIAPNDGGPRDIIANCQNGLLIDPLDADAIEKALLRTLTEPAQWEQWSRQGIEGAHRDYSWQRHAERYVRDILDIVQNSLPPVLADKPRTRRMPDFDRLIITDLDNTLTGDDEGLAEFIDLIRHADCRVGFGIATGRRLDSAMEMVEKLQLPKPDLLDTDCGTRLHYGENMTPDQSWQKQIGYAWNPDGVRDVLERLPGFFPQPPEKQSEFKVSYEVDTSVAPNVNQIKRILREAGLRARVIFSLGMYLDVLPVRGGPDLSMRHLLWKWGLSPDRVLVAGDSENDAGMLQGGTLGVVVGNYSPELERLRGWPRIYFAQAPHARGIIEGIHYYQFLGNIVIPNDRVE
jgi:sucrose-phosphate synthase